MVLRLVLSALVVMSLSAPLQAHAQASVPGAPPGAAATPPAPPPEDPTRPPQRCGRTEADVSYGPLAIGTVVTLQRHRFVHGDDNWDAAMLRFLGRSATITRFSGVDAQGCAGVRVDVDGGTWFWRARDLGLGTEVQPRPAVHESSMRFPQNCGMTDYATDYGSATPGATIILGRHRPVNGDTYWATDMDTYVGRRARILRQAGLDSQGCPCVNVDADGGTYFWRIRDFREPGDADAMDAMSYLPSAGVTSDHGRPATSGLPGMGTPEGLGGGMFGTGGAPGPQACGLTDETVDWGPIRLGARVTLGRHREVDGADNWDPGMDAYIGLSASVRTLIGVDPQGCPIVYVDVDGGAYFWRVRDLTVAPESVAAAAESSRPGAWAGLRGAIPGECGQASGSEDYGPVHVGSHVVLGRHAAYTGMGSYGEMVYDDTDWAYDMEAYVGMTATVMSLEGADTAGCPGVRVDLDGGAWFWRIRDMTMAP